MPTAYKIKATFEFEANMQPVASVPELRTPDSASFVKRRAKAQPSERPAGDLSGTPRARLGLSVVEAALFSLKLRMARYRNENRRKFLADAQARLARRKLLLASGKR